MKYTITHSCGHTEEVELFGKAEERERRIKYLESVECNDCYNKRNAAKAADMNLPALIGSEKQIAWAETLRMELINNVKKMCPDAPDMAEFITKACAEKHAKWWIDHRFEIKAPVDVKLISEIMNK